MAFREPCVEILLVSKNDYRKSVQKKMFILSYEEFNPLTYTSALPLDQTVSFVFKNKI